MSQNKDTDIDEETGITEETGIDEEINQPMEEIFMRPKQVCICAWH